MFYSIITCNKPDFSRLEEMAKFFEWKKLKYKRFIRKTRMESFYEIQDLDYSMYDSEYYKLKVTTNIGLN